MLTPIDFLTDLFNPTLAFLPRALLMAVLSAVVCGVVAPTWSCAAWPS